MPLLSDEQILRARDIDLLSYLQTHEPSNVRKSRSGEYYMVEHSVPAVNTVLIYIIVKVSELDFPPTVDRFMNGVNAVVDIFVQRLDSFRHNYLPFEFLRLMNAGEIGQLLD